MFIMGKIKKKISYNESDFAFIITSIGEKSN